MKDLVSPWFSTLPPYYPPPLLYIPFSLSEKSFLLIWIHDEIQVFKIYKILYIITM